MNPLVQSQLRQIGETIEALRNAIEEARERQQDKEQQRDKLLTDHWRTSKELATMRRAAENYDSLEEQTDRHKDRDRDLQARLRRVLECVKSLKYELIR